MQHHGTSRFQFDMHKDFILTRTFSLLFSFYPTISFFSAWPAIFFFSLIFPLFCPQTMTQEWLAMWPFPDPFLGFFLCVSKAPLYIVGYRNPPFFLESCLSTRLGSHDRIYLLRFLTVQCLVKSGPVRTLRQFFL